MDWRNSSRSCRGRQPAQLLNQSFTDGGFCFATCRDLQRPNAKDQLPGRLPILQPTESGDAGPVNCIRSFGQFRYERDPTSRAARLKTPIGRRYSRLTFALWDEVHIGQRRLQRGKV